MALIRLDEVPAPPLATALSTAGAACRPSEHCFHRLPGAAALPSLVGSLSDQRATICGQDAFKRFRWDLLGVGTTVAQESVESLGFDIGIQRGHRKSTCQRVFPILLSDVVDWDHDIDMHEAKLVRLHEVAELRGHARTCNRRMREWAAASGRRCHPS